MLIVAAIAGIAGSAPVDAATAPITIAPLTEFGSRESRCKLCLPTEPSLRSFCSFHRPGQLEVSNRQIGSDLQKSSDPQIVPGTGMVTGILSSDNLFGGDSAAPFLLRSD